MKLTRLLAATPNTFHSSCSPALTLSLHLPRPPLQAAREKVREADEVARRYWEMRDQAKALEDHAKAVASEAAAEARDAQKKRKEVSNSEGVCRALEQSVGALSCTLGLMRVCKEERVCLWVGVGGWVGWGTA